jgi:hypothetical protein
VWLLGRSHGSGCRRPVSAVLADTADAEHNTPGYDTGVLTVRLAIAEWVEPPTINITAPVAATRKAPSEPAITASRHNSSSEVNPGRLPNPRICRHAPAVSPRRRQSHLRRRLDNICTNHSTICGSSTKRKTPPGRRRSRRAEGDHQDNPRPSESSLRCPSGARPIRPGPLT